jgi:hypothetical protein
VVEARFLGELIALENRLSRGMAMDNTPFRRFRPDDQLLAFLESL